MGFMDAQNAYLKEQRGESISPTDPNYGAYLRGQKYAGGGGAGVLWRRSWLVTGSRYFG